MNEVTQVVPVSDAIFMTENIWIMISAMLVFIMGLGFACVEAGLVRAKCSANVAFKNIAVPAIGITMYALLGFGLMYPGTFNGILGFAGLGIGDWANPDSFTAAYNGHFTLFSDWLFQAMFAATAATIVSGLRLAFPGYVCSNRSDHRFGCRRRTSKAPLLPYLHSHLCSLCLPHRG